MYNDNDAAVKWLRKLTTKGLRHLQMRANSVRELENDKVIHVLHIDGIDNMSDIFTKGDKDIQHYLDCHDSIITSEHNDQIFLKKVITTHYNITKFTTLASIRNNPVLIYTIENLTDS